MPGAWSSPSDIVWAIPIPLELPLLRTRRSTSSTMPSDVCEGCRRLRKKCPKDDCVLIFSLEYLYPGDKHAQGNVTNHLAKFYGRKKFLFLLEQQRQEDRPELFKSLLREAIGRDINPVHGIAGLIETGLDHLADEAIEKVKGGLFVSPSSSSAASAPARSCRELSVSQSGSRPTSLQKAKRGRDDDENPTTPEGGMEDDPPRLKARFDLNVQPKEEIEELNVHSKEEPKYLTLHPKQEPDCESEGQNLV